MKIKDLIEYGSLNEIANKINELALSHDDESISTLKDFLLIKDIIGGLTGNLIPRLACRALVQKGKEGFEEMHSALSEVPSVGYSNAIIETIWYASHGQLIDTRGISSYLLEPLNESPSKEIIKTADSTFKEIIIKSQTDIDLFHNLIGFSNIIYGNTYTSEDGDINVFMSDYFTILKESCLNISLPLISSFEKLLENDEREEVYQNFLFENPIFLDPLASEVIPKKKLGVEYVTDFVIRRLDNKYVVVEIEKPSTPIFTKKDDFTSEFNHAFGQIIDFLEWIDTNGQYARSLMPNVSTPKGLLIIGLMKNFTDRQILKLKRYSLNSKFVEILTFDDLIINAKNLYNNIHKIE